MHQAPPDLHTPLHIGCSGDEPMKEMHRPDQRIVFFLVVFEVFPPGSGTGDYRLLLERLWSAFLIEAGLSAGIVHSGWSPDQGLAPATIGSVWRQHGRERLGTVIEQELFRLSDLLRVAGSRVTSFRLQDQMTTDHFGKVRTQRKLCLKDGEFSIEAPSE